VTFTENDPGDYLYGENFGMKFIIAKITTKLKHWSQC